MTKVEELLLKISADPARMISGFRNAEGSMMSFTNRAKTEALKVRNIYSNLQQQLAAMGLAAGMGATIWQSAKLDKSLTQIGQTAGESVKQVANLRSELFRMGRDSGQDIDSLKDGFNSLVQSGQNMRESLETIKGINVAMAVTGANAQVLAAGLTVAATAFEFDLKKPGLALELLDKMTAAGRLGNAELENLSSIFARVGVNANSAGMNFDSTLAFIEALSLVERQPERLATLADSTLRLFTNMRYMAEAQKGTGIQFFDAKGQRRETTEIFRDIKAKYDTFKTDKERALFMFRLLPNADLDTVKGLRTLLSGDYLQKIKEFAEIIKNAGGTLNRDMNEATKNLVDQAGRLKNTMRQAADEFADPIKEVLADLIKWGLDKKENGGLGLSGGQITGGALAIAIGTYAAAKGGGALFQRMFGKGAGGAIGGKAIDLFKDQAGLAAQITYAKQIQAIAGVTPVYVVNWPNGFSGGGSGGGTNVIAPAAGGAGLRAALTRFGPLAIPAIMLGLTTMAMNAKGDSQDPYTDMAEKALKKAEIKNQIALNIRIDKEGRVISDTSDFNTEVEVSLMRETF